MQNYLNLLEKVLTNGEKKDDRTGVGTYSLFGQKLEFNIDERFPLVSTKKMYWKGIVHELLWYIRGGTDIDYLKEKDVSIWDEWADEDNEVGPLYGKQMRSWKRYEKNTREGKKEYVDQLKTVINRIKEKPHSRRHVMSTWNVGDLPNMALPPCHGLATQFYVRNNSFLDCQMYQRSADLFIGVPFNIASYALFTKMVAKLTGYKAGKLHHVIGDAHIYQNHIEQVMTQIRRKPRRGSWHGEHNTHVTFDPRKNYETIDDFEYEDVILEYYLPHDKISAPVATED